jgi:transcriptional accessory protein Tex/SPT6
VDEQQFVTVWADAEARYQTGQEVRGVVTRVAQFGVFVRVEPGIEGILYTFELGPGPGALANFAPGQEVRLYVKDVDVRRKRLELGLENRPVPGLVSERAVPDEARRKTLLEEPGATQAFPHSTPGERTERHCPTCQRPVQSTWRYCVYCGGTLQRRCQVCGTTQPDLPDARYCCECGKLLS